ncbi:MAG: hypothetical protein HOP95_09015 [Sphingomonas sp.]|nr:hypothetical protein [Sphingomonas sp.]
MRVAAALFVVSVLAPVTASVAAPVESARATGSSSASHCPRTTSYLADNIGVYRGQPLTPKKLTELPPATAYMAVYRHIGGCEAPLTMAGYRNPRRP